MNVFAYVRRFDLITWSNQMHVKEACYWGRAGTQRRRCAAWTGHYHIKHAVGMWRGTLGRRSRRAARNNSQYRAARRQRARPFILTEVIRDVSSARSKAKQAARFIFKIAALFIVRPLLLKPRPGFHIKCISVCFTRTGRFLKKCLCSLFAPAWRHGKRVFIINIILFFLKTLTTGNMIRL